ncbi:MAG: DUF6597 domain-containing transcriptional factor, partial [Bacteroidota bacterium]
MKHGIFAPHDDLATFVKCYWALESPREATPKRNTIVPDGCMKLIFHYGDLYRHHPKKGVSVTLPRCFLIGQLTEPYEVEPLGCTGTFFVCFTPNGFRPFSSLPIRELSNTAVPLAELFGAEGQEFAQKILAAAG